MRAVCDVCEGAPAKVFCAADEAALCAKCDEKVHGCNKLASRHIRLTLAEASAIRQCDICEIAPAFFFCGIDGTSLCLQCDMDVHVGGKRTHERYLVMGQRVELPVPQGDGSLAKHTKVEMKVLQGDQHGDLEKAKIKHLQETSNASAIAIAIGNTASQMIDLNFRPHPEASCSGKDIELTNSDAETPSDVPDVLMRKEGDDG
eukprot:c19923_g1_i1 orf=496-1104(+)